MRNLLNRRPSADPKPSLRDRLVAVKDKAAGLGSGADKGRRAMLAGALATTLPLPALASPEQPSEMEAAFLALAPDLLPLIRRLGPALAEAHRLFEDGATAAGGHPGWTRDDTSAAEAWSARAKATREDNGYSAAWEVANKLCAALADRADPYLDVPMQTLPGIMLKAALIKIDESWARLWPFRSAVERAG